MLNQTINQMTLVHRPVNNKFFSKNIYMYILLNNIPFHSLKCITYTSVCHTCIQYSLSFVDSTIVHSLEHMSYLHIGNFSFVIPLSTLFAYISLELCIQNGRRIIPKISSKDRRGSIPPEGRKQKYPLERKKKKKEKEILWSEGCPSAGPRITARGGED